MKNAKTVCIYQPHGVESKSIRQMLQRQPSRLHDISSTWNIATQTLIRWIERAQLVRTSSFSIHNDPLENPQQFMTKEFQEMIDSYE